MRISAGAKKLTKSRMMAVIRRTTRASSTEIAPTARPMASDNPFRSRMKRRLAPSRTRNLVLKSSWCLESKKVRVIIVMMQKTRKAKVSNKKARKNQPQKKWPKQISHSR